MRVLDVLQDSIKLLLWSLASRYADDFDKLRPVDKVIKMADIFKHFFSNVDAESSYSLVESLPIDSIFKNLAHSFSQTVRTYLLEALVQTIKIMGIGSTDIVLF